jgi:hypothetical protein
MNITPTGGKRQFSQNKAATAAFKRVLTEETVSQFDEICDRCSVIAPKITCSLKWKRGAKVADLGSSEMWSAATCSLCNLFSSIHPDSGNSTIEVFRSLDLSWDLGIEFSGGVLGPWHAHQLPVSDAV